MKKKFFGIIILVLCIHGQASAQNKDVKELYYIDGRYSGSCGNIMLSEILYFASDTLNPQKTAYAIAALCPDDEMFKKNVKYKLHLSKHDKTIKKYLIIYPGLYKQFIKIPNRYYLIEAEKTQ